jgi:ABC-2 type transport system ATP-binding protein
MSLALELEQVCRDFDRRRAVDRLTLRIPRGSIFGLLGSNGAGKTTTIRLLLGLLAPTSGTLRVLGADPRNDGRTVRARTGVLFERSGLYERLSAQDNLEFYGRAWHLTPAQRCTRIEHLLRHLSLWERRAETVATWSRGMQRKLSIARALLHSPELLLLDEPSAGLDPLAASALHDDLQELVARARVTVLLTTHDLAEAERLCGRVGVLREGELLAEGTPTELRAIGGRSRVEIAGHGFAGEVIARVRALAAVRCAAAAPGDHLSLELEDGADVARVVATIVAAGGQVEEVRRDSASLADAFRALMAGER